MNKTVTLTGKGWAANLLFMELDRLYPQSTLRDLPLKWWQDKIRYELRIPDMPTEEISAISNAVLAYWPLSTPIKIHVA